MKRRNLLIAGLLAPFAGIAARLGIKPAPTFSVATLRAAQEKWTPVEDLDVMPLQAEYNDWRQVSGTVTIQRRKPGDPSISGLVPVELLQRKQDELIANAGKDWDDLLLKS